MLEMPAADVKLGLFHGLRGKGLLLLTLGGEAIPHAAH